MKRYTDKKPILTALSLLSFYRTENVESICFVNVIGSSGIKTIHLCTALPILVVTFNANSNN